MIHTCTSDFDFEEVHLANPVPVQNGTFFTKINHTAADSPLYVYTPRCTTKTGIVTSGSKSYMDLIFTTNNTNFLNWMQSLEERLHHAVYHKREEWFTDDIELDDIQSVFMPLVKVSKGNFVVRCYLQQGKRTPALPPVFNDNEVPRSLADIKADSEIICILDLPGIKFSQKSFCVYPIIKQVMIHEHKPVFSTCLIKSKEKQVATEIVKELEPLDDEPLVLKKPKEVALEMYKSTVEEAKKAKVKMAETMQKAKQLKITYGIDDEEE
jgi:Family of unknown function (DUF5871)